MSCDSALAPASVRPATTARIVANATAAMKPRNGVPPSSSATSGAAMLPPASILPDDVAADQRRRAEADDRDDQVEVADEAGGVEHRGARGPRVRHGVEAHQDVRQAEQAEHQRQAERDRVDRIGHEAAGLERGLAVARGDRAHRARPARSGTAPSTSTGEQRHAEEQQDRLDDLHPGGRDHPAEQHVRQHHRADADDGPLVAAGRTSA